MNKIYYSKVFKNKNSLHLIKKLFKTYTSTKFMRKAEETVLYSH